MLPKEKIRAIPYWIPFHKVRLFQTDYHHAHIIVKMIAPSGVLKAGDKHDLKTRLYCL